MNGSGMNKLDLVALSWVCIFFVVGFYYHIDWCINSGCYLLFVFSVGIIMDAWKEYRALKRANSEIMRYERAVSELLDDY